jgi:hypothetical protein
MPNPLAAINEVGSVVDWYLTWQRGRLSRKAIKRLLLIEMNINCATLRAVMLSNDAIAQDALVFLVAAGQLRCSVLEFLLSSEQRAAEVLAALKDVPVRVHGGAARSSLPAASRVEQLYARIVALRAAAVIRASCAAGELEGFRAVRFRTRLKNVHRDCVWLAKALADDRTR